MLWNIVEIYSASNFPQKLSEAPSFARIITTDEIKKYGYRILAEIKVIVVEDDPRMVRTQVVLGERCLTGNRGYPWKDLIY